MLGESYHNNHHKRSTSANFGYRWFELDPVYLCIIVLDFIGIIQLKKKIKLIRPKFNFSFSKAEIAKLSAAFSAEGMKVNPEQKFKQCMEAWETFVQNDWRGDLSEYMENVRVRQDIQLYIENVNDSMRQQLADWVEPIDRVFKEKMEPWDPVLIKGKTFLNSQKYFWETHSIYQA